MVIIGVGNLLMKDDGFGIHVVRALEGEPAFEGVDTVDAMTRTARVLEAMDGRSKAVIVDAITIEGAPPGTVHSFRFDPRQDEFPSDVSLSVHDLHFRDAMQAGTDAFDFPDEIVILGVEPEEVSVGMDLSASTEAALPEVIDRLQDEAGSFQKVT